MIYILFAYFIVEVKSKTNVLGNGKKPTISNNKYDIKTKENIKINIFMVKFENDKSLPNFHELHA